jgi:sec-independent protein translocase protein TatA
MGLGLSNPVHIALILLVLLMVFGAKRLPEMGRSIGSGLREFKDGLTRTAPEPAALPEVTREEATTGIEPV